MGKNADKSQIQIKMLNSGKGPAVQALRAQADKKAYPQEMWKTLCKEEKLTIKEAIVEDLIVENSKIMGISRAGRSEPLAAVLFGASCNLATSASM